MGLTERKRSGNSFAGSKLNVPGQGIYVVKNNDGEKLQINEQKNRIPRPSQTPTPTISQTNTETQTPTPTPTNTETQTPTPTITPTNTLTPTPTITPTVSCSIPSGLTYNNALFEYSGVSFYTSFTETCEALFSIDTSGFTSTGITWGIRTYSVLPNIGDYIWRDPIISTQCIPLDDGYYIINSLLPNPYIIQVSGSTVIDIPTCGIDPISLSQPFMYFETFDTNYLSPSALTSGDSVLEMYRYSDNLYTSSGDTGCTASWDVLDGENMLYFPGLAGGCWPPPCTGSCPTLYYTNQDISFMYQSGYSYTIYFVGKPLSGSTVEGPIFADDWDYPTTSGHEKLYVKDNKDIYFRVKTNGLGGLLFDIPVETNVDSNDLENKNLRVFSVRANDTRDTINDSVFTYVNNTQTTATTQSFVSNDTSTNFVTAILGGNAINEPSTNNYEGYFAELIMFKDFHDEYTHWKVVNFLKNRWNIT